MVLIILVIAGAAACGSTESFGTAPVPSPATANSATGGSTSGDPIASGGPFDSPVGPENFVKLTVVVPSGDFTDTTIGSSTNVAWMHDNDVCTASGNASALTPGLPITVTAAGQTIGQTTLGDSGTVGFYNTANPTVCDFAYTVVLAEPPSTNVTVAVGSVASTTVTPGQIASQIFIQVGF